jgi:hypothetical protein
MPTGSQTSSQVPYSDYDSVNTRAGNHGLDFVVRVKPAVVVPLWLGFTLSCSVKGSLQRTQHRGGVVTRSWRLNSNLLPGITPAENPSEAFPPMGREPAEAGARRSKWSQSRGLLPVNW